MGNVMAQAKQTRGLRRNLKEQLRRDQIKEAAINLFSTKGYQQSTMEDLAAEAGVSKSLIYWYWEGKGALLSELVDTCMNRYIDLLTDAVNSDDPFIDRFYRTLWQYLEISRQSDRLNKLVHFCSLHPPRDKKEDFARQVNNHYRKVLDLLETLISQGIKTGYLPSATDGPAMALALLSLTEGHICMSILEDRISLERIYTGLFFLLFDARQKNGSGKSNSGAASAAPL
jgi:AcrR family transcriptional regulator